MTTLGDRREHYWLAVGMAHRVGADVEKAAADGRLSHTQWSDLVETCRGCSAPGSCRWWLDRTEEAAEPPAFCKNAERLLDLVRSGTRERA